VDEAAARELGLVQMAHLRFILLVFLMALSAAGSVAQKIGKETIVSEGGKRTYYIYVPKNLPQSSSVPLVVLLHGSNHIGLSLAEKWDRLAEKEGFIIVAPNSADSSQWTVPGDGPGFLHELVESIKTKYPINPRKVYLFGHSGGAIFALLMSLYESEYFAATAIHAGALNPETNDLIDLAKRKTPIQIQVGTVDGFFPLTSVRATRDLLNAHGFSVQLVEIPGHDHWYYDLAPRINQTAWDFLKIQELSGEPSFEEYKDRRKRPSNSIVDWSVSRREICLAPLPLTRAPSSSIKNTPTLTTIVVSFT
jgi:acetyl esterase/lipase